MGAASSRSMHGGMSPSASGRWRSPRSVRTETTHMESNGVDCERHNSKWHKLVTPRRNRRPAFGDHADDQGSPIISTPGASADREAGSPPAAGEDKKHCTGGDAPVLSPKAAAILAATEAAIREEEEQTRALDAVTANLPDRPEEPRENGAGAAARKRRQARLAAAAGQAAGASSPQGDKGGGEDFGLSASWLIDRTAITIGKTIGHSSFGSVCEGRLNGTHPLHGYLANPV